MRDKENEKVRRTRGCPQTAAASLSIGVRLPGSLPLLFFGFLNFGECPRLRPYVFFWLCCVRVCVVKVSPPFH